MSVRIISGGQTGVDRAALDAAIELGIPYGGWCPKGGWAEDLTEPPGLIARYAALKQTPLADPSQRTEWNVRDADRLMILVEGKGLTASRGTRLARVSAVRRGKPHIVVDLDAPASVPQARAFIGKEEGALTLCIAGPRESEAPGIYVKARTFLRTLLAGAGRRWQPCRS